MVYYHDISQLCRTGLDDVSPTRMTTLAFILSELFPLDGFRCNFVFALEFEYPMVNCHDTLYFTVM